MSASGQILIVGSLPPTPSNAALLTHMLAARFQKQGIDTCVLIDELSPPPESPPCTVVRPFDEALRSGKYSDWPRLHVIGGKHDSLQALNLLQASPGAAIVADTSLFDLAQYWLSSQPDGNAALANWLAARFGDAGRTLHRAITQHRRNSTAISAEINGYDLLLGAATSLIPLSKAQQSEFKRTNLGCTEPANFWNASDTAQHEKITEFLVVGLPASGQAFLNLELAQQNRFGFQVANRYSRHALSGLKSAAGIAVLDGHDASLCPLVAEALAAGKPVICADQPWLADLSPGSLLPISHPHAYAELVHALQHIHAAGTKGLAEADMDNAQEIIFSAAAGSSQLKPLERIEIDNPQAGTLHDLEKMPANAEGAWPLVGTVPALAILKAHAPGLDLEKSPRFLTPALATYLSALVEEPILRLSDYLGFENPIIDADNTSLPDAAQKKRHPWNKIGPDLITDNKPVAFGCSFQGALAPALKDKASVAAWFFTLPDAALEKNGLKKDHDRATGTFWKYDSLREQITLLLMTGGRGTLTLASDSDTPFLVSDGNSTQIIGSASTACHVSASGVACLKFAAIPEEDGKVPDIRLILNDQPLALTWTQA